jgi:hypothetical protein
MTNLEGWRKQAVVTRKRNKSNEMCWRSIHRTFPVVTIKHEYKITYSCRFDNITATNKRIFLDKKHYITSIDVYRIVNCSW